MSLVWLLSSSSLCRAETPSQSLHPSSSLDVAATFSAQRSLRVVNGQDFWAEGGSIELGANAFSGFGIVAKISGVHTDSIGTSGVPVSYVTELFGPRYRWHDGHRTSAYAEGLVGEANGFRGLFPDPQGAQTDANSLATMLSGGLDLRLGHHLVARALEAGWLRMQLPNSSGNVQNTLHLGAGLALRFGH